MKIICSPVVILVKESRKKNVNTLISSIGFYMPSFIVVLDFISSNKMAAPMIQIKVEVMVILTWWNRKEIIVEQYQEKLMECLVPSLQEIQTITLNQHPKNNL